MDKHIITITEKQRKTIMSLLCIALMNVDVEQAIVAGIVDDVAVGWRDCATDLMALLDISSSANDADLH